MQFRTAAGAITVLTITLACGVGTARRRTSLDLTIAAQDTTFTNRLGYEIELSQAELRIEQLVFYEGPPLFSLADLLVPSAYAHPGHYEEGGALAELLDPVAVDLLAGPTYLGRAGGVTGDYGSAEVTVSTIRVAGTATKDGATTSFSASITLDEPIRGVAVGETIEASSGELDMSVDVSRWLDRADFAALADGPMPIESQPYRAFARGAIDTSSFTFNWKANQ